MRILGAQFNKIGGPDATSSYKIEFMVDESQRDGVLDLAKKLRKGSELLLLIFETTEDEEEIKDLVKEDPTQTKNRMYKRMHAMINDIADSKKIEPEQIKESLKDFLIKKKYIETSTKELDLRGLSAAIYYLQNEYGLEQK